MRHPADGLGDRGMARWYTSWDFIVAMMRRGETMAPAMGRRLRAALLVALVFLPSAGASRATPVYIWRDAGGAIRFSAPPPAQSR
jgi:hypothetical protein